MRNFIKYWLPTLLWMALIFSASSDTLSYQHTSRFLGPLIKWLFPAMDPETAHTLIFVIRKCAHAIEYAVLAWLIWRAIFQPQRDNPKPWSWKTAALTLAWAAAYAASDEFHQSFVPTRMGSPWDVLLDTAGAATGLGLLWRLGKWRKEN